MNVRFLAAGDRAVLIEFGARIDCGVDNVSHLARIVRYPGKDRRQHDAARDAGIVQSRDDTFP